MKRLLNEAARLRTLAVLVALCALLSPGLAHAQGVTTGAMSGIVTNAQGQPVQGASVIAIHEPSGTTYEGVTRADGRFSILGMRVGSPYSVTVNFVGTGTAFEPTTLTDLNVNLGTSTDVPVQVKTIAVQENVTVTATAADAVFSSNRTGAATTVARAQLALLPSISGRIQDVTRLTPQASGTTFAGQDNRMNNITVDGSSFNNSFGLGGQPGDRTGAAPISLEAIEQVQVNVAPFDVRQGSFIGAGVNMVTRSGANKLAGAAYYRFRDQDWVGKEAAGLTVNPGTFEFKNRGGWVSGPIVKNKLFAFGNFEKEQDTRPITTFRSNQGGEAVGGSVTRVLASDLTALSSFLSSSFKYETGPFDGIPDETPVKRFTLRSDYNISNGQKVSFRYTYLDSFTDVQMSTSSSLGFGRSNSTNFLSYQNSNYQILENIRSGIGEWNAVIGNSMSNSLITGYTTQDESRATRYGGSLFPFVDILAPDAQAYTSFGFEPFTPNNELRYQTFQLQDNFTKFGNKHSLTFGASTEKYHSDNVFYPGKQSAYVYNSLADFYTDARDYLANPNRTVSPVTLRRFQVRYTNIPGQEKPLQPLDVWYSGGYAQDEWRPARNLTITAGIRADVSQFGATAFDNPKADALTFRDEAGGAVKYNSGLLPDTKVLWSPRVGFNMDVTGDQKTQLRGGTGLFSGRPAYVWISNQVGNTGVLTGFTSVDNTTAFPFNPNPDKYKPTTVTGAPAASYELDVTDPGFKFPQTWRSNIAVDRRLPFGVTSTTEFIYSKDVNGVYYLNANLPAPQSAFTGIDARPRWVGTACAAAGQAGGCVTRLNNDVGNQVTSAFVLKNGNKSNSWSFAETLSRSFRGGLSLRGAYSFGESHSVVEPGSTASGTFASILHHTNPNSPDMGFSANSPGHRAFALASFTHEYFSFGGTSVSLFYEARTNGNTSYVFSGDLNGDTVSGNDLIYIPKSTSEMNFVPLTIGARTFTAAEQATAFEAYITQDKYMSAHRGEYAERNAVFLPLVKRADLSVTQEIFHKVGGQRNAIQIRADFFNFFNLLNSDWGVGKRLVQNQILVSAGADANGAASYRFAQFNGDLVRQSFQTGTSTTLNNSDVYQFIVSLRYSFN